MNLTRYTDSLVKKLTQRILDTFTFLKVLVRNPRITGAVLPSSNRLAMEMVSHVEKNQEGFIVELGAGTGVVTSALLKAGIQPERIIAIELSEELAKKLQKRFPRIQVIEGNAVYLDILLGDAAPGVKTIISGLPLRSLPKPVSETILQKISNILKSGGKYIQFTYSLKQNPSFVPMNVKKKYSKMVWLNLPPARVDVFEL
jgi:phosphatidylethanolamine/phosphatidyl-N-methylethanolamine N-methyltransferase